MKQVCSFKKVLDKVEKITKPLLPDDPKVALICVAHGIAWRLEKKEEITQFLEDAKPPADVKLAWYKIQVADIPPDPLLPPLIAKKPNGFC